MLWIMFDKYLRGEQWGNHNSARPKVPRHDSLGAGPIDSNNPLFTGTVSALGGGHVRPGQAAKNCTCTTSSKCTVSIRHGPNKPTRPQLGHTWPNFGPTWLQDGARNKFGPSWDPYGFKMDDKPAQSEILKIVFSLFLLSTTLRLKGSQVAPLWTWLGLLCAAPCFFLGSICVALGPTSAGQVQVRPNPSQFCGPNAMGWKLICLITVISNVFLADLGPNFGTRCPHTGPWRAC